jgi:hypothetical protein
MLLKVPLQPQLAYTQNSRLVMVQVGLRNIDQWDITLCNLV